MQGLMHTAQNHVLVQKHMRRQFHQTTLKSLICLGASCKHFFDQAVKNGPLIKKIITA